MKLVSNEKTTVFFMAVFLILCMFKDFAHAGLFSSIPKGKVISDPEIEKLFTPDFPYEDMKVIETDEGKRYLIIKAKNTVTTEIRLDYEKMLQGRGIVIYRASSKRTNRDVLSEMYLYRTISQDPYVVEYSMIKGQFQPGPFSEVESVIKADGRYLLVLLGNDFGKKFTKIEIYPDKEKQCPDFLLEKYPGSKTIGCTKGEKEITYVYVTKAEHEKVYDYYRKELQKYYKQIWLNYEKWGYAYGIEKEFLKLTEFNAFMKKIEKGTLIEAIPDDGLISKIKICRIGVKHVVKDFSIIKISYSMDRNWIREEIEMMRSLHPEENR